MYQYQILDLALMLATSLPAGNLAVVIVFVLYQAESESVVTSRVVLRRLTELSAFQESDQ